MYDIRVWFEPAEFEENDLLNGGFDIELYLWLDEKIRKPARLLHSFACKLNKWLAQARHQLAQSSS